MFRRSHRDMSHTRWLPQFRMRRNRWRIVWNGQNNIALMVTRTSTSDEAISSAFKGANLSSDGRSLIAIPHEFQCRASAEPPHGFDLRDAFDIGHKRYWIAALITARKITPCPVRMLILNEPGADPHGGIGTAYSRPSTFPPARAGQGLRPMPGLQRR